MKITHGMILSSALMAVIISGCQAPEPARPPKTPEAAVFVPPARTGSVDLAVVQLQSSFASKKPDVRAQCVEAIQFLNDARAISMIQAGLSDSASVVRFASAIAAGRRKAVDLRYQISKSITDEQDASVRVAMIFALHELGDDTYMPELAGALRSTDAVTRANTAMILGYMGDPSAIPMLHAAGGDKDPRVRFEVTAALARLGDAGATSVIIAMSLSRYVDEHLLAVTACPDIKRVEVANVLLAALKDSLPEGQLLAARGLGKLGSTVGKKIALKYMTDENPDRRALAALAWGDIFRTDLEDPLVRKMQEDSDPRVKLAAAAGLISMWVRAETPPAVTQ